MDNEESSLIIVQFKQEGMHYYEDAPDEVDFLREPHRHLFHVRIEVAVTHLDRELEYFMVRGRLLQKVLAENLFGLDKPVPSSCETMAKRLMELTEQVVKELRPDKPRYARVCRVQVMEDGENGSIVEGVLRA